MSDEPVLLDVEGGVATVTLNRPGMRNALTMDVAEGVVDAVEEIERSDARCVVLAGAEGTFCAGGDVNAMMELQAGEVDLHEAVDLVNRTTGRAVARVATCPLPTVAKVEGAAFGAGGNLAIACDLQVMAADAEISFGFRDVGLAVDSGTSYLLPRVVGENVAMELVFTGERVGAERAADLGLVNRVYPAGEFDERAAELVEKVADGPTAALKASKRLLRQGPESSIEQAITNESAAQAAIFRTDDHREGVEAFMEGRRPEFEGS